MIKLRELRLPLAVKITSFTIGVVSFSSLVLSLTTLHIVKKEILDREWELKTEQAHIFATQTQAHLQKIAVRSEQILSGKPSEFNDPEILAIQTNGKKMLNGDYFKMHALPLNFIDRLRSTQHFPNQTLLSGDITIKNSTIPGGPPLLTMIIPLKQNGASGAPQPAIVDFKMDEIQNLFASSKERVMMAIDAEGNLLSHQIEKLALSGRNMSASPIVNLALNSSANRGFMDFADPQTDGTYEGVYEKTTWGLTVIALTAEEKTLAPLHILKRQLWFIYGICISLSLLFSVLFSTLLTAPVKNLLESLREFKRSQSFLPSDNISNDELGDLTVALSKTFEKLKQ